MFNFYKKKYPIKFEICSSPEEIAEKVLKIYKCQLSRKPNSVLGLATGSTPIPTYKKLVESYAAGEISFKDVSTFNLDEYIDLDERFSHESYENFMDENLFNKIDIKKTNVNFPNKNIPKKYDQKIKMMGGIDVQLLGLGVNGHIAFNEPGTNLCSKTHTVEITESTRNANSRFFNNDINLVPKLAVTMGINSILKAKKIILIATGENKSNAIWMMKQGKYTKKWPCTSLVFHNDVTVFVDNQAAQKIK